MTDDTLKQKQKRIDELVAILPDCLAESQKAVVEWLNEFTFLGDNCNLSIDRIAVADVFKQWGYASNSEDERTITIKEHGLEAYGNRLIEFSIHFLQRGDPTPKFVERCAELYLENCK